MYDLCSLSRRAKTFLIPIVLKQFLGPTQPPYWKGNRDYLRWLSDQGENKSTHNAEDKNSWRITTIAFYHVFME